jgi:acylphosphatase
MACRRFHIEGKVQGVWYRAATRDTAVALGLVGYAANLADGSVEVVACGDVNALDTLADWLWEGPPLARVERVESAEAQAQAFDGFTTR